MKKLLLIYAVILFFSYRVDAQCLVTFVDTHEAFIDLSANSLVINTNECDPCLYGGLAGGNSCECHNKCEDIFDDCVQECQDNFVNLATLTTCVESCIYWRDQCKNNCGTVAPTPVRTISSYVYAFEVYHVPIPNSPWDIGDPLQTPPSQTFVSNMIPASSVPLTITSPLFEDWSEIVGFENYCIISQIVVFYTDGECCSFLDVECQIIG